MNSTSCFLKPYMYTHHTTLTFMHFHISNYINEGKLNRKDRFSTLDLQ